MNLTRKKILVVDPEISNDDILIEMLTGHGFRVSITDSAESAWRLIGPERPDLVLLETMLPHGTEGFHFVWRLRNHSDTELAATPIIIVSRIHQTTALNLFPELHDGHYASNEFLPVQGFIDKPVDHTLLTQTIFDVMGITNSIFNRKNYGVIQS